MKKFHQNEKIHEIISFLHKNTQIYETIHQEKHYMKQFHLIKQFHESISLT